MASRPPAPAAAAQPPEGASNVTPEEQAQYDRFVGNALEIIYPAGEEAQVAPAILSHLKGQWEPEIAEAFSQVEPPVTDSPVDALAGTTVLLVLALESSASAANAQIDDDVVYHGGVEILEALVEVAEAAGIHDFSEEDMEGALYRALDLYRNLSGRVDPEALKAEFGQAVEADKAGQLDQLLPGIGERVRG